MVIKMIEKLIYENIDEIIKIRRDLHKIPELSGEEYKTAEYIRNKLSEYGIPYSVVDKTGTVALIKGKISGKTVLLRADIDALPIEENNTLEFKSEHRGIMHACGHDIHAACVLYAGKILNGMKDSLKGNIKLVFQPQEEDAGGAEPMITAGVMENPHVDASFALHVEPLEKCGFIQLKDGAIMASPDDFEIEITGKGGHGALPHECIDVISIGSAIVAEYNSVPSKYFSAQVPCVVSVCSFNAGNCPNVFPDKVKIQGTARSLDEETRQKLETILGDIAKNICDMKGAECKFTFNKRYPPTINDAKMNNIVEKAASEISTIKGITYLKYSSMCGDDFAYFARLVPSSYFRLGVGNDDFDKPIHNSGFMADENALPIGVAIFAKIALNFLES